MNESILLIEDEHELCNILTLRLNKEGYAVDTAGDGVTGYRKALNDSFDLHPSGYCTARSETVLKCAGTWAGWIGDSNCVLTTSTRALGFRLFRT